MLFLTIDEKQKYLGFDDRLFMLVSICLLSLFIPIAFFTASVQGASVQVYAINALIAGIHSIIYWMGMRAFMVYIRRRINDFSQTKKRISYEILFVIIYCGLSGALIELIVLNIFPPMNPTFNISGYIATYFTSFFFLSIYEGIYLYYQNQQNYEAQARLKREHINSELQGLRNQVNPHFLFNSMNTLMNIIPEDQKLASDFLMKLSSVYRYILEKREDHLIPLKDELKFIESYVFLQKERFKEKLTVNIEVSDEYLDWFALPLSLQILFENSIKHNIISKKQPLTIDVYIDQNNNIVVRNNYNPKNQELVSTGVGLENISARISYFTDKKTIVKKDEHHFKVSIPLLTNDEKLAFI